MHTKREQNIYDTLAKCIWKVSQMIRQVRKMYMKISQMSTESKSNVYEKVYTCIRKVSQIYMKSKPNVNNKLAECVQQVN